MRRVVLDKQLAGVEESAIKEETPIFAMQKGILKGMVVKDEKGWILRIGGEFGSHGHSETRETCLVRGLEFGYEYFIE